MYLGKYTAVMDLLSTLESCKFQLSSSINQISMFSISLSISFMTLQLQYVQLITSFDVL